MNFLGYFTYIETITLIDKDTYPLINASNKVSGENKLSIKNYFYTLQKNEIEELNRIYDFSQKINDFKEEKIRITKENWFMYKAAYKIKINPLNEEIKKSPFIINEDNPVSINIRNKNKTTTLTYKEKDLFEPKIRKNKPLFTISKNNDPNNNCLYLEKKGTYKNDGELFYMVLNCLFNAENTYYIKKCQRCGKFYITTKINKLFCDRPRIVCEINTTCQNALNTLYKSKEYREIRRKANNHLSKYRKKNDEYSNTYINLFSKKLDKILDKCKEKFDITKKDLEDIEKLISS